MTSASHGILRVHPGPPCHGGLRWEVEPASCGHDLVTADVNDAWYPPAPEVLAAMLGALVRIQDSPPTSCAALAREVARCRGLKGAAVEVGPGASFFLERLIPPAAGAVTLVPAPSYSEYEYLAARGGAAVYRWLTRPETGFAVEVGELAAAARELGAALVVVANPANPAGTVLDRGELEELLGGLPEGCRLLVDEAYIDWAPGCSAEPLVAEYPQLCVVRTFSKGPALAGVRLGYAVLGSAWSRLALAQPAPWSLGLTAVVALEPALEQAAYVAERIRETGALRDELVAELAGMPGLRPLPSRTHYFLVELARPWPPAGELIRRLLRRRVLVRDAGLFGDPLGPRWIRITTRSRAENRRLLQAFRTTLQDPL